MRGNAKILLNMHSLDTGFVVWTLGVNGAFWGRFAVWRVALASSQSQVITHTGDQSQLTW